MPFRPNDVTAASFAKPHDQRHRSASKFISMFGILFFITLPAQAITLVKCKIAKKTVYSDTACPINNNQDGHSAFGRDTTSKPIKIKSPKKKRTRAGS